MTIQNLFVVNIEPEPTLICQGPDALQRAFTKLIISEIRSMVSMQEYCQHEHAVVINVSELDCLSDDCLDERLICADCLMDITPQPVEVEGVDF